MIAVLVKELRTRMRGWRTPTVLTLYLIALGAVCYLALRTSLNGSSFSQKQAATVGINVFTWLSYVQIILIVVITPATTSAAISGERQRQTLDLLLVTRLSSLGITLGKLLAAISFNLLLIICSLPIFGLVFLFGGVGPDQLAEVFLIFLTTVFSFGSIGILVSALAQRANAATVVTYVIVLMITLGLALLTLCLQVFGADMGTGSTPLPLTAYFDPGFGLAAVLPQANQDSGLSFDFQIWQVNIVAAIATTIICVALCAAFLREHRA
jgi:ABC-type transport system involved in multi-copper enzyme maturation permease subunit